MRSVTALQMLEDGVGIRRLSFGCKIIDKCVRGGLPLQGINEIVGEAGAGKTQFALTLSLQCHLRESVGGLSGATAYLCCGEGSFPVRRLEQLAHSYDDKFGISYTEFMKSVYIEQCHNADDVLDTLGKKIPKMCTTEGIRLIVIDSIAGMVRTEYDTSSSKDMSLRTSLLFRLAKQLKWLSDTFHICVVVVNQVTAIGFDISENDPSELQSHWGDSSNPALGLAWAHCVNTRIRLRRDSSHFRSIQYENGVDDINVSDDDNIDVIANTERNTREFAYNNDERTIDCWRGVTADICDSNKSTSRSIDNHSTNIGSSDYGDDNNIKASLIGNSLLSSPVEINLTNNHFATGEGVFVSHASSRLFTLELSPCNEKASCLYEIRNDGIFGLL